MIAVALIVAAFAAEVTLSPIGRFMRWFEADRGTGPGKCGWP
ncbi:hypothetical protein PE067_10570 [Paracoccus sp. DMF-8]|nr:hypothetical protein [Paracoccus sp. DMF-8]MDF3606544.1 hypothetical protein [Paracoccus sp. DMF-8]